MIDSSATPGTPIASGPTTPAGTSAGADSAVAGRTAEVRPAGPTGRPVASAVAGNGGTPASILRVAAIQADPAPGDVAGNAATAARLAAAAAERGARLVVLPELFLTAYHPPTLYADPDAGVRADAGGRVGDVRLDPLRAATSEHGVVVVVGSPVRYDDGRRTCAVLVADTSGTVTVGYDKQHLWGPDERALFTAGAGGATVVLDDWHLALAVCYDGCFPEHARAAAMAGAHGYLCPSGYVVGSQHRRDLYYAARALDNTMYVAFANSVGGTGTWRFNGGTALYDPEGRVLGRAGNDGEATVLADFDPAALAETRAAHTMLRDRLDTLGDRRFLSSGPACGVRSFGAGR